MKAKSRNKSKRDNETPEKCLSDDDKGNVLDGDLANNKSRDFYADLKITEETLQEFFNDKSQSTSENNRTSNITVRCLIPQENRKMPTQKICVLKKAPSNVPVIPSSSLIDQNNLRFDSSKKPVQYSILGTVEDYFRISLEKDKIKLEEIPSEYHHALGFGPPKRPLSAMIPTKTADKNKENIKSHRIKSNKSIKCKPDFDTNALRLWEQRMMERKKLQNHISKTVNRAPVNLIYNSAEEFRETMEKRYLISKAIPFYGAGYGFRSGSEFWQQNEVVGINPNDCIHMTNTQTEKGYPPPVLHVGVSNIIKQEKKIFLNGVSDKKKRIEYEIRRLQELNGIISELNPHDPDFSRLVVIGDSIKNQAYSYDNNSIFYDSLGETKKNSLESENLSRSESIQESERTHQSGGGPCLLINFMKLESRSAEPVPNSQIEIRMLFNCYAKDKCVEQLLFQNRGTSIIRYWWKKIESFDPFNLENKNIRRFYFKTEDDIHEFSEQPFSSILLPNEDLNLPIIFKSAKSGIFTEVWKIETIPLLANGNDIVIILKGIALQNDVTAAIRQGIDSYMKYQVADNISRTILDEIIQNIGKTDLQHHPEDSFENTDRDQFVQKNNGFFYEIENINSLKKLNEEIAGKELNAYDNWRMDCGLLRKNIVSAKSIKSVKKEEIFQKFYKHMDKATMVNFKASINHREHLYKIGYRILLEFFGKMVEGITEIRRFHDLPDITFKIANDRKRANISRQKTNFSQVSKKSTSTQKSKSKELSNLARESTDNLMNDSEEVDKFGSQNFSEIDETIPVESEQLSHSNSNLVEIKCHSKTYQLVYSMLNKALDNIIECWEEITSNDL